MKPNTRISTITANIASALALAASAHAYAKGFAKVPPYLQNENVVIEQPKVKHNIMFLVDNSGSMYWPVGNGDEHIRIKVAQQALNSVLDKYQDRFNWGIQGLTNVYAGKRNYTLPSETFNISWQNMKNRVDAMRPYGYTPATRRYYEVAASAVMPNIKYRCQKSYIIMLSDGDANLSCSISDEKTSNKTFHQNFNYDQNYGGNDQNTDLPEDFSSALYSYSKNYKYNTPDFQTAYEYFGPSPMKNLNTQQLINVCNKEVDGGHGSSYWDLAGTLDGKPGGIEFFSRTLSIKDIKTSGKDAAGVSWNGDPSIDPKGVDYSKQLVQTFTVGFGSSLSQDGKAYLARAASRDDWYFNAAKSEDLLQAFDDILKLIEVDTSAALIYSGTGSTAPATVSSGIPELAATVHVDSSSWSSRIEFDKLASSGHRQKQNPKTVQPSFANRRTLINTGSAVYDIARLQGDELNNAYFGIADSVTPDKNRGEWLDLLKWTARIGKDSDIANRAKTQDYSQNYRIRLQGQRDLGDILDGSIATVGEIQHNRRRYLAAAANDGMVHLFESTGNPDHPYDLKISYIPAGIEGESGETLGKTLKYIAKEDYPKLLANHRYTVNGGFTLRQTDPVGGKSHTLIFGATGQGGRGAYALNIDAVNDDKPEATLPLFETPKGEANTLGYTVGTPQIARISVNRAVDNAHPLIAEHVRYAGFLASGYRKENPSDAANETALYIYDMLGKEAGSNNRTHGDTVGKPGDLIAKITAPKGIGGLSTPAVIDTDFDGLADLAYAGDRGGNMYRFDLRGKTPKDWKAVQIFQGSGQPVTSAPAVSRRPNGSYIVIFGTGSEIYQDDLTNDAQQSAYGIYDNPHVENDTGFEAATRDQLQTQTVSEDKGFLYVSDHGIESSQKGWKIDLARGERITVKPTIILRTAVLTIHSYTRSGQKHTTEPEDVCLPTSSDRTTTAKTTILGLHADNGGALTMRSARFTPDSSARTDNGKTFLANGVTRNGLLNFSYLDAKRVSENPTSLDGEIGGSGKDNALQTSAAIPNNRCFSEKAARTLLLNATDNLDVQGRRCGIRRISWRELFF